MSRARARRLSQLEPAAPTRSAPCIIELGRGETLKQAVARFAALHLGSVRHGLGVIVVPSRVITDTDRAEFKVAFYRHQTKLIADARSDRLKDQENVKFV